MRTEDILKFIGTCGGVYKNVYAYEHGDMILSTDKRQYPFCDRWDAYQIGVCVANIKQIKKNRGWSNLTKERKDALFKEIDTLINEYSIEMNDPDRDMDVNENYWGREVVG
jgi:hypothetical protein